MTRRGFLALILLAVIAIAFPFYWASRWRYIVIHHSGGGSGDLELLLRVHRQRQARDPIDEIPYHFVIGNGRGMGLGEVAETGRWQRRLWGAHMSRRNPDRNMRGIGICLIGNFETTQVPEAQFQAALALTRQLMQRFSIPPDDVSFHGGTPGEMTLCPGRNFPRERFIRALAADASRASVRL
jgi:N-acetylmuramoyl-L-alanine amidase